MIVLAVTFAVIAAQPFKANLGFNLSLTWSINNDQIDVQLALSNKNAWAGFGISGVPDPSGSYYGMGLADFWVANFVDNTVLDMYRTTQTEGTPCQDSLCLPTGTDDLFNVRTSRSNGLSLASFSRNLNTNDNDDWQITTGTIHVIYAVGTSDTFGYHQGYRGLGRIDFFLGNFTVDPF